MGISISFNEINTPVLILLAIISGFISIILLILAESLKRGIAKQLFQEWFQYRKISFVCFGIILFSGTSVFFSYQGANRFIHEIRVSPTLVNMDSIKNHYTTEIANTDSLINDNFKKNSWKGKLSRDARPTYNVLHAEKVRLAQKQDEQLIEATKSNNETLLSFNQETEYVASSFGMIQIGIELAILICLFWMEYYDYRSAAEFAHINKQFPTIITSTPTVAVSHQDQSLLEQEKQLQKLQVKRTIEHNGKHYTENQVNNFIRIYEKRSTNSKSEETTQLNNRETLNYWLSKKEEFHILEFVTKKDTEIVKSSSFSSCEQNSHFSR